MTDARADADKTRKVWELVAAIDYCMFVTKTPHGLRSRPMSSIVDVEARSLHFLAAADGGLDDEIMADPQVLLAYSNGSNGFVSLRAGARVSRDRALIKGLWNPGAQAFWPEGPETAKVCAILVDPQEAEYWEGSNRIVSAIKFAAALVTGSRPDLGDSGKTTL